MPELYLLHFSKPYWRTCQHYVGSTKNTAEDRLKVHLAGTGARICRYAIKEGIGFQVVYREQYGTVGEARKRERQLKRERNLKSYCPICKGGIDAGVS